MTLAETTLEQPAADFDVAATVVLGTLRSAIANVLSSVGGVRKPAELQKSFKIDWTLSWQLFQVAGLGSAAGPALTAGANVPSRSSLKKFLDAAVTRGVEPAKVTRVWNSYEQFERLVDVHAGDRTSFNSMVSAAGGIDDEWIAADTQHRRNAFRAMSHVVGMQARAKHICGFYNSTPDGAGWDLAAIVGYVGLRMLRALPHPLVFRMRMVDPTVRSLTRREPLGDAPDLGGGYLLSRFSTRPLPALRTREMDAGWLVSELDRPGVGNLGAATLRFATAYRNHPVPHAADGAAPTFEGDVVVDKPVEVLISDAIVRPGLMRGARPTASVCLGNNHGDGPALPGDLVPILGDHRAEFLGTGPEALATPEVPDYPEMVRDAAARLGWEVDAFEVWRIRIEFPVYQATVRMQWTLPGT